MGVAPGRASRRPRWPTGRLPRGPACGAATCCSPSTAGRSRARPTSWPRRTPPTQATPLTYTLLRLGSREIVQVRLAPIPQGNSVLYFVLAAVGIFTLLVGASVRLRRPGDQATLHFFWLTVAFFGVFAFSFTGRFDRLDWVFYWADMVALLAAAAAVPALHAGLPRAAGSVGRARRWARACCRCSTCRRCVMGGARVMAVARLDGELEPARAWSPRSTGSSRSTSAPAWSAGWRSSLRALGARAVGHGAPPAALDRLGHAARRRAVRARLRGAVRARASTPSLAMELLGGAARPRSRWPSPRRIVRYRLMDVEVIVKRGLVYAAAVAAIVGDLRGAAARWRAGSSLGPSDQQHGHRVLATLVVVLLARPVKNAIQNALDRVFYRDRYDYRRALVGFARDLNTDLDLDRLERAARGARHRDAASSTGWR